MQPTYDTTISFFNAEKFLLTDKKSDKKSDKTDRLFDRWIYFLILNRLSVPAIF